MLEIPPNVRDKYKSINEDNVHVLVGNVLTLRYASFIVTSFKYVWQRNNVKKQRLGAQRVNVVLDR